MNVIFDKEEIVSDYWKTRTKPLYKIDDKSEYSNYSGISLTSVGIKFVSMMIRIQNYVTIRKEQYCI